MTPRREKLILAAAIASFAILITLIGWLKYRAFLYNGLDLAIYNQVFWNTIHGHWFASFIHAPSYIGDHAEWLIALLAPFYAIKPHPLTLVVIQALALGAAAIPLYCIAKKFPTRISPLFFPIIWLLNPIVWNMALCEFHILPFAIPLLFTAAYFFISKKFWPFIAFCLLALLVREDVSFAVSGFSLIAAADLIKKGDSRLARLKKNLHWILVPIILAFAAFFIDQKIISGFNPDGTYKYLVYYSWLGNSFPEIIKNIFLHPHWVIIHSITFGNIVTIAALIIPFLFLPFFRTRFLLLSLIPLMQYLLSGVGVNLVVTMTQYSALFMVGITLAALDGLPKALDSQRLRNMRPILPLLVGITTVYTLFSLGPISAISLTWQKQTQISASTERALALIPENASVLSSFATLPNLSSRDDLYSLHYFWVGKRQFGISEYKLQEQPDFIMIDTRDFLQYTLTYPRLGWTSSTYSSGSQRMRDLIAEGKYGPVFEENGVILLAKNHPANIEYAHADPAVNDIKLLKNWNGPLELAGWYKSDKDYHLLLRLKQKMSDDAVLKIGNEIFPLGNGIYPTSEWKPDQVVEVTVPVGSEKITVTPEIAAGYMEYAPDRSLRLVIEREQPFGAPISLP